jgi:hypothetical protein
LNNELLSDEKIIENAIATAIALVTNGMKNNDCKNANIFLLRMFDKHFATINDSNIEIGTAIKTYKKEFNKATVNESSSAILRKFFNDQTKLSAADFPLNPSRKTI